MRGLFTPCTIQSVPTLYGILCRSVSSSHYRLAVDKGMLSKLRKQTGIPFINCKKALEKFDNDFDQAKQWLQEQAQKEGWARATKLQTRPMSQGLVALMADDSRATLLEVNCETDFVARNEKFISMVTKLVQECHNFMVKEEKKRVNLSGEDLGQIVSSEQTSLADIVALNVGNLGENMALRRADFLRASERSILCSYVHPATPSTKDASYKLGKYGAVVELCPVDAATSSSSSTSTADLKELGNHLCQHIVGMNPKTVGEFSPESENKSQSIQRQRDVVLKDDADDDSNSNETERRGDEEDNDDELLSQDFLLDSSVTVGELLNANGVEVANFVRFACGEELDSDKPV